MPSNFWWLFSAYSIVWVAVFLYLMRLLNRQRELERDVRRLQRETRE